MRAADETMLKKVEGTCIFFKVRRVVMVEFKGTGGRGGEGRRENLGLIGHLVLWCRNYKTSP